MEPLLNVTLITEVPENKPKIQRFRRTKLSWQKCLTKKCTWLLVFGETSKTKIQVTTNIIQIHANFVKVEGKATIQFCKPNTQCLLNTVSNTAESRQALAVLLSDLKTVCKGHAPPSRHPTKKNKLIVSDRESQIWRRCQRLFDLSDKVLHLTFLELEGKQLTELPKELSDLGLQEMRLKDNLLGLNGKKWWDWLDGRLLFTLRYLFLDKNKLSEFPMQILNARNLTHLSLSSNNLTRLPDSLFGPGGSITSIFLSNNPDICYLPSVTRVLKTLDISECWKLSYDHFNISPDLIECSRQDELDLLQLASTSVLKYRIPYGLAQLPRNLTLMLNNAKYCKRCGSMHIHGRSIFRVSHLSSFTVKELLTDLVSDTPIWVRINYCNSCIRHP